MDVHLICLLVVQASACPSANNQILREARPIRLVNPAIRFSAAHHFTFPLTCGKMHLAYVGCASAHRNNCVPRPCRPCPLFHHVSIHKQTSPRLQSCQKSLQRILRPVSTTPLSKNSSRPAKSRQHGKCLPSRLISHCSAGFRPAFPLSRYAGRGLG